MGHSSYSNWARENIYVRLDFMHGQGGMLNFLEGNRKVNSHSYVSTDTRSRSSWPTEWNCKLSTLPFHGLLLSDWFFYSLSQTEWTSRCWTIEKNIWRHPWNCSVLLQAAVLQISRVLDKAGSLQHTRTGWQNLTKSNEPHILIIGESQSYFVQRPIKVLKSIWALVIVEAGNSVCQAPATTNDAMRTTCAIILSPEKKTRRFHQIRCRLYGFCCQRCFFSFC